MAAKAASTESRITLYGAYLWLLRQLLLKVELRSMERIIAAKAAYSLMTYSLTYRLFTKSPRFFLYIHMIERVGLSDPYNRLNGDSYHDKPN